MRTLPDNSSVTTPDPQRIQYAGPTTTLAKPVTSVPATPTTKPTGFWPDAILSIIITATLVHWSMQFGRLLFYPQYDDVSYFFASLLRMDQFHRGFSVFLAGLKDYPAHSPVTEVLGMAAFAILGVHDWAPYAANGLLLFIVLRFLRHVMADIPGIYRYSLLAVALSTRLFGELIVVFRPDLFYGLILAIALIWILSHPILAPNKIFCVKMGAFLGALLLIKTSVYPQTLALLGLAVILRTLCDIFASSVRRSLWQIIPAWATITAVGAIIAAPHYIFAFREVNDYIFQTLFGERRGLWQFTGTLSEKTLYYITGIGGAQMLGATAYILLALLFILAVTAFFLASKPARFQYIAVAIVLFATYLLPTLNKTKSAYLGLGFQSMLIVSMLYFANEIFRQPRLPRLPAISLRILCLAAAFFAAINFSWPAHEFAKSEEKAAIRNQTVTELYAAVRACYAPTQQPQLMVTTPGLLINPVLFAYIALRDDHRVIHIEPNLYTVDPRAQQEAFDRNDYIIAPEPGTGETLDEFHNTTEQINTLALLRTRTDLREIATVKGFAGGQYFLFVKRNILAALHGLFRGIDHPQGLSEISGPWPEIQLPAVRFGQGSQTTFDFQAENQSPQMLVMNVLAQLPNQALTITLNGKPVDSFPIEFNGRFYCKAIRLIPTPGINKVEIHYSQYEPNDLKKAVLFYTLQVIPASEY